MSQEPVEALSKKNSPETVIEIQNAIAEIQGTPAPRIANNVFESSPHLLIEKGRVKGNNNQLLDGSYTDLPDQYTLQIRGETCGLYYAKTDTFVSLSSLDCEPIIKFFFSQKEKPADISGLTTLLFSVKRSTLL